MNLRALRLATSAVFMLVAYQLLAASTFAMRLRDDVPLLVPGLDAGRSTALILALALSVAPLLAGSRYLTVLVASGFVASGIGAYWWTQVPWDELITDSAFAAADAARLVDFAFVAAPAVVVAGYVGLSHALSLRGELESRGAEPAEAAHASRASWQAASVSFAAAVALAFTSWALVASGFAARVGAPLASGGLVTAVVASAVLALAVVGACRSSL